jgi:hypothetical protein
VERCQGQAGVPVDLGEVEAALREVITTAGDGDATRELAAAAHAELALVVAPAAGSSDRGALEESLVQSRRAAELSLRPRNQAIYRWQEAFYASQLQDLDAASAALEAAAAKDPAFDPVTVEMFVPQASGRLVPSGVGAPASVQTGPPLAVTGRDVGGQVAAGFALVVLGALMTAWSRRLRPRVGL